MRPRWIGSALFAALLLGAPPLGAQDDGQDNDGTIWSFLQVKYDADGDGSITRAEYDREDATFLRLDSNDDGVLTSEDFASSGERGGGRRDVMSWMMTQRIMMSVLASDDTPDELRRDEIPEGFARLDADEDGLLVAAELQAAEISMDGLPEMMRDRLDDPFASLASQVDADKDGALSEAELLAWFDEADDGDGVLSRRGQRGQARGRQRGRRGGRAVESESAGGPAPGTTAPDFTLPHLGGEGEPVSLSSYAGKQPVALIFGSYT